MPKTLSDSDIVQLLKKRLGGRQAKELAEELGISKQYLSEILNGSRPPGPAVIEKLGMRKVYVPA